MQQKSNYCECPSCPFVEETKVVKSTANNFSIKINTEVNCQTKGIVAVKNKFAVKKE